MERFEFIGSQPCEIVPGMLKKPGDPPFSLTMANSRRDYLIRAGVIRLLSDTPRIDKPASVEPAKPEKVAFRK